MTDVNCLVLRPFEEGRRSRRRVEPHVVVELPPAETRVVESPSEQTEPKPESAPRRGVWALADQGAVSLGNCATNVLLVRGLGQEQYGAFAILLEAMLFLNTLQAALVVYPLSVRGASMDTRGLRRLAGACLLFTLLVATVLGAGVFAAAGALAAPMAGILATVALLLWQCQETLRRAMMAHGGGGHRRALLADIISYVGQAIVMYALVASHSLTIERAFAAMAGTSALAVIVQSFQVGPLFDGLRNFRRTALDFWRLGRWVMFGNFAAIVTTLSCSWTLAYFHGTGAVAQFQALAGLMKFSNPLTICMAGLIVPAAARAFRADGIVASQRVARRYGLLTAAALAPYFGALVIFPSTAIGLLYGWDTPYASLETEMRAFVVWYTVLLVAQVASCYLNAIEQSRRGFVAQVAQAITVVLIALPMTALFGLNGLMLGGVIGNVVLAGATLALARNAKEPPTDTHRRYIEQEMQLAPVSESIPTRLAA